jgi:hypothetical protein
MRKSILLLPALLLFISSLSAQKIKYESSFTEAKVLALAQHKPIAVLITIQPSVSTPNFLNGLNDKTVIETFNNNFINYKVDRSETPASAEIIGEYKLSRFPSFIFLDAKGGLMFTDVAFLSGYQPLLEIAAKAVAATKEKSLVDYDSTYAAGDHSAHFLKAYITKRQKARIVDNADLVEYYVNSIKVEDLNNYADVLFILKAGPVADGTAYKLAHINRNIIDSIYRTEPLSVRVAINNAIIANTMNSAIAHKDLARANAAANFVRSTWTNNPAEGQKNWVLKMLQYYRGVKDTARYLQLAAVFYDQYYMHIGVDSIRRKDSLDFVTAKNKAFEKAKLSSADTAKIRTFSFIYAKDNIFANELNNAAWYFYQTAGNNTEYLLKAMLWSKRSVELDPKPGYYDTYAHLLYQLKFYDEAESMQRKAVELSKTGEADNKTFEQEYEKIKKKTL